MEVRKAELPDTAGIALLLEQLGYPVTEEFLKKRIQELMVHPDEEIVVAADGDEVLGFIAVHFIPQLAINGPFARISYFCVDEKHRSSGLGQLLEQYCESRARERGCDRIEVHCNIRREAAHRFYKSLNYHEIPKYFVKHILK